jgi:hypothetical protein
LKQDVPTKELEQSFHLDCNFVSGPITALFLSATTQDRIEPESEQFIDPESGIILCDTIRLAQYELEHCIPKNPTEGSSDEPKYTEIMLHCYEDHTSRVLHAAKQADQYYQTLHTDPNQKIAYLQKHQSTISLLRQYEIDIEKSLPALGREYPQGSSRTDQFILLTIFLSWIERILTDIAIVATNGKEPPPRILRDLLQSPMILSVLTSSEVSFIDVKFKRFSTVWINKQATGDSAAHDRRSSNRTEFEKYHLAWVFISVNSKYTIMSGARISGLDHFSNHEFSHQITIITEQC